MSRVIVSEQGENRRDVNIITDLGGVDRLAVDTGLRFRPRFYADSTDIDLPSDTSDTTIATINADGRLDFISVNYTNDQAQFVLEVDGVEVLRIDVGDLHRPAEFDLRAPEGTGRAIYQEIFTKGTDHIIIVWSTPVDFTQSVVIKSRRIGALSVVMDAVLVRYRERIP